MVRKIILALLCVFLVASATGTALASATDSNAEKVATDSNVILLSDDDMVELYAVNGQIYDGNISTSNLTYFRDIVAGLGINDNYVLWRSGQYTYTMVAGDLEFDGVFEMSKGREYVLNTNTGYNSYYTYEVHNITDFSLDPENALVYSNIGNYPHLEERGVQYEFATLLCVIIISICILVNNIFKYVLRNRC